MTTKDGARPATVLLVEDDPHLRSLLGRFLTGRGMHVLPTHDGAQALSWAHRYRDEIDLVITDVVLPNRDGFDLAAEMVALKPETPVLFLTGHARQDPSLLTALRLSGSDCLFKPFTERQLLRSVDRALRPSGSMPVPA